MIVAYHIEYVSAVGKTCSMREIVPLPEGSRAKDVLNSAKDRLRDAGCKITFAAGGRFLNLTAAVESLNPQV